MEMDQSWDLICQGAEARVYRCKFLSRDAVVKERFVKTYRYRGLDSKITAKRTVQEARCLCRAQKAGVRTPSLYCVDLEGSRLFLELLDGEPVKTFLRKCEGKSMSVQEPVKRLCEEIGRQLALLHDAGIIHGDPTTSNMFLLSSPFSGGAASDAMASGSSPPPPETVPSLAMIDFGLSVVSNLAEDKAVDLYVMERAFTSTHPGSAEMVQAIIASYEAVVKKSRREIMAKLTEVRARGRKRTMVG